ncbi:MAG: M23 family metallopeptidase [Candidatus Eremiobacteraeota bacterium]|nr:M23 family metallopeptidase [Candidatus Eremiobacteraeota bacterium]
MRHIAALAGAALLSVLVAFGIHLYQLRGARVHVEQLQAVTAAQKEKLGTIDAEAGRLSAEIRRLERQNAEIRRAIGIRAPGKRQSTRTERVPRAHGTNFASVESDLARLARESERASAETLELHRVAARILNVRRLEAIERAQVMAAIPSVIPAGTGEIASPFGWRSIPWPEYHRGVDLVADYGDVVRAAAKGTVAFAGWDGGYGNKIVIDHGNGLATWYCHLERIDVRVGQEVFKGAPIAAVGSTGEATGPHLHYQVMENGNAIDPAPFLNGEGAKVLGLDTFRTASR